MSRKFDEVLFDKRVIQKNLERGLVAKSDYEDFLKSLKDESVNAERLTFSDNDLAFKEIEVKEEKK